nr:hypothetical protein GCM10020185_61880 [Pseudomonas brassicacearum subsp. brassicacearum]
MHGVRWNLTGQLFRIQQLRALGYSVLAIDYRGFGKSHGDLPSEASVYEDARIAWERLKVLQPDPALRLIYGHSLGGAVAVDLAAQLGQEAAKNGAAQVRGLVIESTFTSLGDVATAMANTSLPVRWLLSQKFDSIDKNRRDQHAAAGGAWLCRSLRTAALQRATVQRRPGAQAPAAGAGGHA